MFLPIILIPCGGMKTNRSVRGLKKYFDYLLEQTGRFSPFKQGIYLLKTLESPWVGFNSCNN